MLKCLYLLFDENNLLYNAANYILALLLIISITEVFVFFRYNISKIKKYAYQSLNIKQDNDTNNISKMIINNKKTKNKRNKKSNIENDNNTISNPKKRKSYVSKERENYRKVQEQSKQDKIKNIQLDLDNNDTIKGNKKNILKKSKIIKKKFLNKKRNKGEQIESNHNLQSKNINSKRKKLKIKEIFNSYNDNEMNSLEYKDALKNDKRTYWQYYISLLRTQHILIFSFFNTRDYNSQIIKIYIFFFTFVINYVISAMFYSDSTMHKIYIDEGSFDFTYQLPQMFYSFLISTILTSLLSILGLYEKNIIIIKNNKKNKILIKKEVKKITIKVILFFISTYILLFLSWIYLGCFCAVYKNTQMHLLLDVSSSFGISFISPFIIYLIPGLLRIPSLKNDKRSFLFKLSNLLQMF